MAREQHDRENLLAEATGLGERVELRINGFEEPVFAGFRANGCFSLYLGQDPVYHFNARRELRRVYVAGKMVKAEQGRLVSLDRQRTGGGVHLAPREFTSHELATLASDLQRALNAIAEALAGGSYQVLGQAPADADVIGRMRTWLAETREIRIAKIPHAR